MTGRKFHLLLVEDNPADVQLLQLAVSTAGVECDFKVIDDGLDAIDFVGSPGDFVPDLAILDLNLPRKDGVAVLAAMRESSVYSKVRVAVLTSSSSPRDKARTEGYNISRYIPKPPDLDEYMRVGVIVRELLDDK